MKLNRTLAALAAAGFFAATSAHAGLDGKTITLRYDASGHPTTFDSLTVGNGVEVTCPGSANVCALLTAPTQTIDFSDLAITYKYVGNGNGFNSLAVNGFSFLDLNLGPGLAIGNVLVDTNIFSLETRVSFTANSVKVSMSDLAVTGPTSGFTLTLVAAPVPEPAAWALMLAGFAGVCAIAARKRTGASPV